MTGESTLPSPLYTSTGCEAQAGRVEHIVLARARATMLVVSALSCVVALQCCIVFMLSSALWYGFQSLLQIRASMRRRSIDEDHRCQLTGEERTAGQLVRLDSLPLSTSLIKRGRRPRQRGRQRAFKPVRPSMKCHANEL